MPDMTPIGRCRLCGRENLLPFWFYDYQDELQYGFCAWSHLMEWVDKALDAEAANAQ
jgi:hypothetical protein